MGRKGKNSNEWAAIHACKSYSSKAISKFIIAGSDALFLNNFHISIIVIISHAVNMFIQFKMVIYWYHVMLQHKGMSWKFKKTCQLHYFCSAFHFTGFTGSNWNKVGDCVFRCSGFLRGSRRWAHPFNQYGPYATSTQRVQSQRADIGNH